MLRDGLVQGFTIQGAVASGGSSANGIVAVGAENIEILNNDVSGVTDDGIRVENTADFSITGNSVDSPGGDGIEIRNPAIAKASANYTISGNTITNEGGLPIREIWLGCGNGVIESPEQCDGGACCSPSCTFLSSSTVCRAGSGDSCDPDETCTGVPGEACPSDTVEPAGTLCRAAADACDAEETCTGAANDPCPPDAFEPAGTDCPNSTLCDGDETCDGNGNCIGGPTPECDDGSACTVDSCDATLGCLNTSTPLVGCLDTWQKGVLVANENPGKPSSSKVVAKFIKGPAISQTEFGKPLEAGGTSYEMCIFDAFGDVAASFKVDRAGDQCAGRDCWKTIGKLPPDGKGYKYKDKDLGSDGVLLMKLKGGSAGKSKVIFKTKNKELTMPSGFTAALEAGIPVGSSALMQLIPVGGGPPGSACLSLELDDVSKNEDGKFRAKFKTP